jgi:uncharacterized protein YjiS (DUF1127 family)
MTCMSFTRPGPQTAPRRPPTVAAAALSLVRTAWRAYWDWSARRTTVMILRSLDRRTLHDIGINPSEIESLVNGCRDGDRRRRYDAAWPWRSGGA